MFKYLTEEHMTDTNNQIINYYDEIAESYDNSRFDNTYGQYVDYQERRVLDGLKINPERTLDLPCGTGRFLNYADYGCDASKNMVKIAASHWIGKNLVCSDARKLPYEHGTFDTVITMHLLMHLDDETIGQITKEVHRVLRPGGRWIVDLLSDRRKKVTNNKYESWHCHKSMSIDGFKHFVGDCFQMNSVSGIMLFPVHRIPSFLRKPLRALDYRLAQTNKLKEYSTYLIYELCKR